MSITNAEVAIMENLTAICCSKMLLQERVHARSLSDPERAIFMATLDGLRELERSIEKRIEVKP